jgi:hypothetical protein
MSNSSNYTAWISAKERLDISAAKVRFRGEFRFDFTTVIPTDRFQFKIVWPHKNGARWWHYAHNYTNRSEIICV